MTSYLRMTFLGFAALIWGALLLGDDARWPSLAVRLDLVDWAIIVLIVASVIVVLRAQSRLVAITALGGVGAAIAIVFVLYGAIDVAMTQLFVEILVVVFLAIAMVRLPPSGADPVPRPATRRSRSSSASASAPPRSPCSGPTSTSSSPPSSRRRATRRRSGATSSTSSWSTSAASTRMGEIAVIVIAGVAAVAALMAGRKAAR